MTPRVYVLLDYFIFLDPPGSLVSMSLCIKNLRYHKSFADNDTSTNSNYTYFAHLFLAEVSHTNHSSPTANVTFSTQDSVSMSSQPSINCRPRRTTVGLDYEVSLGGVLGESPGHIAAKLMCKEYLIESLK